MNDMTYKIHTSMEKKSGTQVLVLEGDLSIQNAGGIKNELSNISFNASRVCVRLKHVVNLDLAGIQVLHALMEGLRRDGKNTEIEAALPDDLKKLVSNAGFRDLLYKNN
jgi:ABC-type transporter Mla MlaB component